MVLPFGYIGSSITNTITFDLNKNAVSGNINVYGTNLCGNGGSSSLSITVNLLPDSAGIISDPSTACKSRDSVTYNVPTIDNATEYIWSLPLGASGKSTSNTITVYYNTSTVSGIVSVLGQNICGTGYPSSLSVTLNEKPATPVISFNGITLLSDAVTGNQWFYDNRLVSGATNQYFVVSSNGSYFCIVTINGCSSDTSNIISFSTGIEFQGKNRIFLSIQIL